MSIHGKALNNKYAIVFGIAGGYYLTQEYDNTFLTVIVCIICVLILMFIFDKILY